MSATTCSRALAARIGNATLESAVAKSWRRSARTRTRAAAHASEPAITIGVRARRASPSDRRGSGEAVLTDSLRNSYGVAMALRVVERGIGARDELVRRLRAV